MILERQAKRAFDSFCRKLEPVHDLVSSGLDEGAKSFRQLFPIITIDEVNNLVLI